MPIKQIEDEELIFELSSTATNNIYNICWIENAIVFGSCNNLGWDGRLTSKKLKFLNQLLSTNSSFKSVYINLITIGRDCILRC
jgi:hypothetical protein